ncbi:tail completion or Neck1 protein [Shigella phage vB_SflS-ISF001]|uniref:Neck protein n=1 Tax=Shigella phage vB_SflS-ISF001 TaxID=2048005 RepID=A0A2D1GPY5_9CAUD|nr:tail completion or Neck1 protein [Shigella phage vB_SflS-ISF001]ATN94109.1 hypothetical protein FLXISF001_031 [Shigella phage vB_SflS-ISF001]
MANYQIRRFQGEIDAWIKAAESTLEHSIEIFVRDVHDALVSLSPVDTGRFLGNWQLTFNEIPNYALNRYDRTGVVVRSEEQAKSYAMFSRGGVITSVHFSNMLIYAGSLEYGHSQLAPNGVVGLVALRLLSYMADAIKQARRQQNAL